jgi:hypothetical protein
LKPAQGAPSQYSFKIDAGVLDLPSATRLNCNAQNKSGTEAPFSIGVPVDIVPPSVRSFTSTREEITLQFNHAVVSDASGGTNFGVSAVNTANYIGHKKPEIGDPPFAATLANTPTKNVQSTGAGYVNYNYYDPNRVVLSGGTVVNGVLTGATSVISPGFVTVNKKILNARYNADATAVTLQVEPMVEGQGTNQPEQIQLRIPAGAIQDLNTNAIALTDLSANVQTGRADWVVQLGATSDVPGASPDTNNFFGVRGIAGAAGSASNGLDGPDVDITKPFPPGNNFISLFSTRGKTEPGFEGQGGNFAQELQSRPGLNEQRSWNIGVTSDLGATGAPATITLTANTLLAGQEVPATDSVELDVLNPQAGEPTSIDLRTQPTFKYSVTNNGLSNTRFFKLVVTSPTVAQAPFQLSQGFNLIAVPIQSQNPAVGNVFFGLSPLVVYRYNPATGYEIFPSTASFSSIEVGRGYWVNPRSAGYQIKVLGVPVVGQQTLHLRKGWNLIADPYTVPVTGTNIQVGSGGNTLSIADAVRMGLLQDSFVTFDPVAHGYTAPQPLSTGTLQPWRGYFVLAFSDVDLVLNKPNQATTTP